MDEEEIITLNIEGLTTKQTMSINRNLMINNIIAHIQQENN